MTANIASRIRERLADIEAGPAVFVAAAFLLLSLAAWIFLGQAALNGVLITTGVLLIWNAGIGHSRNDEGLDRSDKALSSASDAHLKAAMALAKSEAIHGHLTGLEPASNGKHAEERAA